MLAGLRQCYFSFWEEHAPDGESSAFFTQHTLGDGNIIDDPEFSNSVYDLDSGSPCIDTGFDGGWNGDESYGTDDVDEAELLGFPTDFISSWPPLDDDDADNVRPEGSSWDIGAQESD